jgi:hypothetical protein
MDDIRGVDPIYKGVVTANDVVLAQGREKNRDLLTVTVTAAKSALAVLRMRCQV